MFAVLSILISIANCSEVGKKFNEMAQSMDILSTIMTNIDTQQLVQIIYDPLRQQLHAAVTQELRERISDGRTNSRELLLAMHRQRKKGKMPHFEEEISENVRMGMQRSVNEVCSSVEYCDLSAHGENSGIISNGLLEALAYFYKEIVVPSNVTFLNLQNLKLTSLWLRFEQNSCISTLILLNNDFEELNHQTFCQYLHANCHQRMKCLNVSGNKRMAIIDFDEMKLPNLDCLSASNCAALVSIWHIPSTMEWMHCYDTKITNTKQIQFKEQTGNPSGHIVWGNREGGQWRILMKDVHQRNKSGQGAEYNAEEEGSVNSGCPCVIS